MDRAEEALASGKARGRPAGPLLARRITRVALGLAFGLVGKKTGDALVLFGFPDLRFRLRRFFRGNTRCFGSSFALGLFGRFARQLFLLQPGLFGLAYRTSFEDCLAFGLSCQHRWMVCCRPCLEALEKRLLCFVCGIAPLENVFFPIDSQVHFPGVNLRGLHTRENPEFKRQNGMPAMKF